MSAELIYQHMGENPEYIPNKFDIVGRFETESHLGAFIGRIGAYYGSGELAINESEFENITTDIDNIIIIGEAEHKKLPTKSLKSATTVETRLMELFGKLDYGKVKPMIIPKKLRKTRKPRKPKKPVKPKKIRKGSAEHTLILKEPTTQSMRLCDVTDEMLYYCPDMSKALNDSSDGEIESNDEENTSNNEENELNEKESSSSDEENSSGDEEIEHASTDEIKDILTDEIEDISTDEIEDISPHDILPRKTDDNILSSDSDEPLSAEEDNLMGQTVKGSAENLDDETLGAAVDTLFLVGGDDLNNFDDLDIMKLLQ